MGTIRISGEPSGFKRTHSAFFSSLSPVSPSFPLFSLAFFFVSFLCLFYPLCLPLCSYPLSPFATPSLLITPSSLTLLSFNKSFCRVSHTRLPWFLFVPKTMLLTRLRLFAKGVFTEECVCLINCTIYLGDCFYGEKLCKQCSPNMGFQSILQRKEQGD